MRNVKILMLIISVLVVGKVVAQETAEPYYEPELLMVSQPKMELYSSNDNDYVQFYYDVENIGSETYKGDFMILMEPDVDHFYVRKSIKVKSGEIKRIKMEMDLGLLYYDSVYSVLPVYEFDNQWYPLTAYEKFTAISLCLNAPLDDNYVVTSEPAPVTDYYFDARLQRPPVYGYYYVTPPPGWAYAYGYNPCCVCSNYVVVENNGSYSSGGGYYVGNTSAAQTVVVPNVSDKTAAPRVSSNNYSNSAASGVRGKSSGRNDGHVAGGAVSTSRGRSGNAGSSSGITTSGSRNTSSSRSSSSVNNSSNSRSNSSSRPSTSSSSTISNSTSRSSSSRGVSNSNSSSSSSSSRGSGSSSSSSSGGRRR